MTTKNRRLLLICANPASLLSLAGTAAATLAMILAVKGVVELALVGLMLAGLADLFDGVIARRLVLDEYEKEFGIQLDTVVDAVSFVATPVVVVLCSEASALPIQIGIVLFVMAGMTRLAHFNTSAVGGTDQSTHHQGLPVTYTALIFPFVFLLSDQLPPEAFQFLLGLLFPLIGLLFVVNIPVPKPRGVFYLILPLLALALSVHWIRQFMISVGHA